jgi:ADP-ribose pyrophosphatase
MEDSKKLEEKRLERQVIYKGSSYEFYVDTVELPNGEKSRKELVKHPGGVAILALDQDNNVLMEDQYRYAIGQLFQEIPAGKMDKIPGEQPLDAAKRELREETGRIASDWKYLGKIYPSPGIISEVLYLFLAKDLSVSERELDSDEFINVKLVPLEQLKRQIADGEISDCKVISALALARLQNNID